MVLENAARWNAAAASFLLALIGLSVTQSGPTLVAGSGSIDIARSCTGSFVFMSLAAAVIPFPVSWKSRLMGILGGLAILISVNLFRIVLIVLVFSRFPDSLWTFHVVLGQALVISGMLFFFLWWVRQSENPQLFYPTQSNKAILKSLFLFIIGYTAGYWLYAGFLNSPPGLLLKTMINHHATWFTSAASRLLALSGMDFVLPAVNLVDGCLASPMVVFLAALIFAWPVAWKKKIPVLVLGCIPFFYFYHLLRAIVIFATLGLQSRETNMAYHLYGQMVLSLFLLLIIAVQQPGQRPSCSGNQWGRRLLKGLVVGIVLGVGAFFLANDILSPMITRTITGRPCLSHDPQQTISLMPFLQTSIWTALMWIRPNLTPIRRWAGASAGILVILLLFAGVVLFLETFQLSPHVGLSKLGIVLLPFLAYILSRPAPASTCEPLEATHINT
jgi:exosortase/archaeosortase family protein